MPADLMWVGSINIQQFWNNNLAFQVNGALSSLSAWYCITVHFSYVMEHEWQHKDKKKARNVKLTTLPSGPQENRRVESRLSGIVNQFKENTLPSWALHSVSCKTAPEEIETNLVKLTVFCHSQNRQHVSVLLSYVLLHVRTILTELK